jgi:hypothetical protein
LNFWKKRYSALFLRLGLLGRLLSAATLFSAVQLLSGISSCAQTDAAGHNTSEIKNARQILFNANVCFVEVRKKFPQR